MKIYKFNELNESDKSSKVVRRLEHQLYEYGIEDYTINSDGTIDVDGDVAIQRSGLKQMPFKFGRVTGHFSCSNNEFKTLDGCPNYVGGDFFCINNKLNSLKGSPSEVGGHFGCIRNEIKSLEGMPLEIGGDFSCFHNKIEELNSVSNIEGNILCDKNVDVSKFDGHCLKIIKI